MTNEQTPTMRPAPHRLPALRVLRSDLDASVNFVQPMGDDRPGEMIESRFVKRRARDFIIYLSSQTGCNRGCRMCHLTATRQTRAEDVDLLGFCAQVRQVCASMIEGNTVEQNKQLVQALKHVHFNFMARGEPLMNRVILGQADTMFLTLSNVMRLHSGMPHLGARFNVSTIMPATVQDTPLTAVFTTVHPTLYYSLYSLQPEFRRRWLPAAMDPQRAGELLHDYQRMTRKTIKLHHCLIRGENDGDNDASLIIKWVHRHHLQCEFNLVRYNPPTDAEGMEATAAQRTRYQRILLNGGVKSKTIERVGYDVQASCGMFVNGRETASAEEVR